VSDPHKVREALLGGSAKSFVLENHGKRLLDGALAPGFRANLMLKDIKLALGAGDEHTVPRKDDGALRISDRFGKQLDLSRMSVKLRLVAGKSRLNYGGARMRRRGLAHQRIFGDVNVHRSWSTAACKVKRLGNNVWDLIGAAHQIVMLRHR
jgi:hypothetical protein